MSSSRAASERDLHPPAGARHRRARSTSTLDQWDDSSTRLSRSSTRAATASSTPTDDATIDVYSQNPGVTRRTATVNDDRLGRRSTTALETVGTKRYSQGLRRSSPATPTRTRPSSRRAWRIPTTPSSTRRRRQRRPAPHLSRSTAPTFSRTRSCSARTCGSRRASRSPARCAVAACTHDGTDQLPELRT